MPDMQDILDPARQLLKYIDAARRYSDDCQEREIRDALWQFREAVCGGDPMTLLLSGPGPLMALEHVLDDLAEVPLSERNHWRMRWLKTLYNAQHFLRSYIGRELQYRGKYLA
jgi:hypothetical protein